MAGFRPGWADMSRNLAVAVPGTHKVITENWDTILAQWKDSLDDPATPDINEANERGGVIVRDNATGEERYVARVNQADPPTANYEWTPPPLGPNEQVVADVHTHPSATSAHDGPMDGDIDGAVESGLVRYVVDGNAEGIPGFEPHYDAGNGVFEFDPATDGYPEGVTNREQLAEAILDPNNPIESPDWAKSKMGRDFFKEYFYSPKDPECPGEEEW